MKQLEGVWTALWTPTDSKGNLNKEAIIAHVKFLQAAGIDGIVVGGSTGEFRRLSLQKRLELLKLVRTYSKTLPLIVNISAELIEEVEQLAASALVHQAAGVLVLPPSYYAIPQRDLVAYFLHVATFTKDLPFLLYNFPECVRNTIMRETVIELAQKISIGGIKQSGSDFDYHKELVEIGKQYQFTVFTGADTRLAEAVKLGVKGSIGGCSNAIPELILTVFKGALLNLDVSVASNKIQTLAKIISPLDFPYDVAALMQARGLEVGIDKTIRSADSIKAQQHIVELLKHKYAEWYLA